MYFSSSFFDFLIKFVLCFKVLFLSFQKSFLLLSFS
ncbi:hypothetical protein EUBVEN_01324 [Eubacterium ventriosum ATCC 27560]|uniref:Uncharacterized protein n=1 Tax=Eubacterium ventriosum ATCC 27560 TaxID=411463 RepID=A5Z6J1_9FIRM|nr:hypothetical protein EUBVEN_01324 [Eubacterium ventriosum ATCC 27560]